MTKRVEVGGYLLIPPLRLERDIFFFQKFVKYPTSLYNGLFFFGCCCSILLYYFIHLLQPFTYKNLAFKTHRWVNLTLTLSTT